jgi:hypothetical protein
LLKPGSDAGLSLCTRSSRQINDEDTMKIGICALCKQGPIELCDSHLIPKSIYRIIHDDMPPIMIDPVKNVALYDSKQVRKHLLCSKCEDRFSKYGENIVLRNHCRESDFPLRDVLEKTRRKTESRWQPSELPSNFDTAAFTYFALSILWRASVTKWNNSSVDRYFGALGPKYEEAFRLFLLGKSELPKKIYLYVIAASDDVDLDLLKMTSFPFHARRRFSFGQANLHWFVIPGIEFNVFVGGEIQQRAPDRGAFPMFELRKFYGSQAHRGVYETTNNSDLKGKLYDDRLKYGFD